MALTKMPGWCHASKGVPHTGFPLFPLWVVVCFGPILVKSSLGRSVRDGQEEVPRKGERRSKIAHHPAESLEVGDQSPKGTTHAWWRKFLSPEHVWTSVSGKSKGKLQVNQAKTLHCVLTSRRTLGINSSYM